MGREIISKAIVKRDLRFKGRPFVFKVEFKGRTIITTPVRERATEVANAINRVQMRRFARRRR